MYINIFWMKYLLVFLIVKGKSKFVDLLYLGVLLLVVSGFLFIFVLLSMI